jgi:hypothetical protein
MTLSYSNTTQNKEKTTAYKSSASKLCNTKPIRLLPRIHWQNFHAKLEGLQMCECVCVCGGGGLCFSVSTGRFKRLLAKQIASRQLHNLLFEHDPIMLD